MKPIEHPSHWINKRVVQAVRNKALEAEGLKQLHPDQLKVIHEQGWLKMFIPKTYGGLELSLPEVLKIEEALAWTDGSTAWVVTLCAGAGWFVGFIDPSLSKDLFAHDKVCIAGSGATKGTAEITFDGYLLNGTWKYASGSLHASAFTANCLIKKKGKPLLDQKGKPVVKAFVMKPHEVTLHFTWNSMGMVATGSHSFEVMNLKVPHTRSFQIDSTQTVADQPVFQYPFLQLAETTLAVNVSGLAIRFFELAEELLIQKKASKISNTFKVIHQAKTKLEENRKAFYKAVEVSWKSCAKKKVIPGAELRNVSKLSQALANQSRQLVNMIYPHCGLTAADSTLEINRVWRNLHTSAQHSLFKK